MQEPEIFEQPVAAKDPEAVAGAVDDNHTYHTGYGSGYQTNHTAEDSSLDDYHDFVYPEGAPRLSSFQSFLFFFFRPIWAIAGLGCLVLIVSSYSFECGVWLRLLTCHRVPLLCVKVKVKVQASS